MRTLSKQEITLAIQHARALSEEKGSEILERFQNEQPELYQAIFGELLDVIARENTDMAYLYLDLCFDVICVYKQSFGNLPANVIDMDWLDKKSVLLNAELKSLGQASMIADGTQLELLNIFESQVEEYASIKPARQKAVYLINTLLLVVVRLFNALYNEAALAQKSKPRAFNLKYDMI